MSIQRDAVYAQLLSVLESSDKPDTQTQKYVRDFLSAFENSRSDAVIYFLEVAMSAGSLHARQISALLLKKNINLKWSKFDNELKEYLKRGLIKAIQMEDAELRNVFGAAFVALFSAEGFDKWPVAPGFLLGLVTNCSSEVVRETAGSTLLMLVEETVASDSAVPYGVDNEIAANDNFSLFVANDLIPKIIELGKAKPDAVVFISKMLLVLMDTSVGLKNLFYGYFDAFWSLLGTIAPNKNSSVRNCVLKGMMMTWDRNPLSILESSHAVFSFVTECCSDTYDNSVQLEALEFWPHILREGVEHRLRIKLVESLKSHVPILVPVLMENTKYTSWDYMSMDESHFEDDNANVPDRAEDVPPRPECALNSTTLDGEDDKSNTWGTNWTVRKGAALALDHISLVYGNDPLILSLILESIENKLGNVEDWESRESAVLALGAISRGSLTSLSPYLPRVMAYLIDLTVHKKPLMRSIACWCISRFAVWVCNTENEAQWLEPVLKCILSRVLDANKRVQEAACSALASFIEDGGSSLVVYLRQIVETLVRAFEIYQARNYMILYDAIGTLTQAIGEALPTSGFGVYLMQQIMQRLSSTGTYTPQYLAMTECLSTMAQFWGFEFYDFATAVVKRSLTAVVEVLVDAKKYELADKATDLPRWDVVESSVDLLSSVTTGLGERMESLIGIWNIDVDESCTRVLGTYPAKTIDIASLLVLCCQHEIPGVLQACFALVGDMSRNFSHLIASDLILTLLVHNIGNSVPAVCNNSCWALGMLTLTDPGKRNIEPYLQEIVSRLSHLLHEKSEIMILQNACISLGRLALVFPERMGKFIPKFLVPWSKHLSEARNDNEKAQALQGICSSVSANMQICGKYILEIASVFLSFPPYYPQLETCMKQLVLNLAQLYPREYDATSHEIRERLNQRFSGSQCQ